MRCGALPVPLKTTRNRQSPTPPLLRRCRLQELLTHPWFTQFAAGGAPSGPGAALPVCDAAAQLAAQLVAASAWPAPPRPRLAHAASCSLPALALLGDGGGGDSSLMGRMGSVPVAALTASAHLGFRGSGTLATLYDLGTQDSGSQHGQAGGGQHAAAAAAAQGHPQHQHPVAPGAPQVAAGVTAAASWGVPAPSASSKPHGAAAAAPLPAGRSPVQGKRGTPFADTAAQHQAVRLLARCGQAQQPPHAAVVSAASPCPSPCQPLGSSFDSISRQVLARADPDGQQRDQQPEQQESFACQRGSPGPAWQPGQQGGVWRTPQGVRGGRLRGIMRVLACAGGAPLHEQA
jgi:hypothetical protein